MALTKSFRELVQRRVAHRHDADRRHRHRQGDPLDYIKATVGFEKLGEAIETPAKSLIRMFGPRGNPQARNLFGVIGYLQKQAGIELHVAPQRSTSPALNT
jgi:hypothetical protein